MKNRYLILLAGLLVAGSMLLVACGDKNDKPADTKAPTAAQTDPATDPSEETTAPEADTTVAEDDTTVAEDDTTVAEDDTTVADETTDSSEEDTTAPIEDEVDLPYVAKEELPGFIKWSFDTVYVNGNMLNGDGNYEDKMNAIGSLVPVKGTSNAFKIRGWIGFDQEIEQFGYIIDDTDAFYGNFKAPTEDAILQLAGEYASRFEITTDLSALSEGDHIVTAVAKLADGTIAELWTILAIVEEAEEVTTEAPKEGDPTYNVDLEHLYMLGGSDAFIHKQSCDVAWGENNEYLTFTITGGDPYVVAIEIDSAATVTNRLYIIYRTTVGAAPEFFVGSTGGWTGAGDHLGGEDYIADGEWHVMVVDLSGVEMFNGTTANYLRYDFFSKDEIATAGSTIDIKMVAFFNNDKEADAYISENYGLNLDKIEDTESDSDLPFVSKEKAGLVLWSFDNVKLNGESIDGGAGYEDKMNAINNTITVTADMPCESIEIHGWIGFTQAIDQFGYAFDNANLQYGDFKIDTEEAVLVAGGEFASRFETIIPIADLSEGTHSVTSLVKLADGTVAEFWTLTLVIEARNA